MKNHLRIAGAASVLFALPSWILYAGLNRPDDVAPDPGAEFRVFEMDNAMAKPAAGPDSRRVPLALSAGPQSAGDPGVAARECDLNPARARLVEQLEHAREETRAARTEIDELNRIIQELLVAAALPQDEPENVDREEETTIPPPLGEREADLWDQLNAEVLDPDWFNEQTRRLIGLFDRTLPESGLVDMRCGETLCRIRTVHESDTALGELLDKLGTEQGLQVRHFVTPSPVEGNRLYAVVYFSRQGFGLPWPS